MTENEFGIFVRTVWDETRGEPVEGAVAVGYLIIRRAEWPNRWDDSVAGVCIDDRQFSGWNHNAPHREAMLTVGYESKSYLRASYVASGCLLGLFDDPADGATHYYNPDIVTPWWHDDDKVVAKVGRHLFLKLA